MGASSPLLPPKLLISLLVWICAEFCWYESLLELSHLLVHLICWVGAFTAICFRNAEEWSHSTKVWRDEGQLIWVISYQTGSAAQPLLQAIDCLQGHRWCSLGIGIPSRDQIWWSQEWEAWRACPGDLVTLTEQASLIKAVALLPMQGMHHVVEILEYLV